MTEHEGAPPEEPFDPSNDDPQAMKENILREAAAANVLERGLEADREPEPEEKDERGLTPSDYSALDELGIDRATLKPTRSRPEPPVSDETSELLHQAAERELEWSEGIDAAVRYAQRDPEGFTLWVEDLLERETEDVLEEYGVVSIADLPNSETFAALSPEEQGWVYEQLQDGQAATLAREVIEEIRQAELPQAQAELADARAREQAASDELWNKTTTSALGATHLSEQDRTTLAYELAGFQDALRAEGPGLLEKVVDGFDSTQPLHMALYQQMCIPLNARQADDGDLAFSARALRAIGSRTSRAEASHRRQMDLLRADSSSLPMEDDAREKYLADAMKRMRKPVITLRDLKELMKADPTPPRTGKQVARDIKSGARSGGPTSAQIRAELDRVAKKVDKRIAREKAARGQGVRR